MINQNLLADLNSSKKIFLTPSKVKDKYVIRFVANQEVITKAQIERGWKTIQDAATELLKAPNRLEKMLVDPKHFERYSFVRIVSKEVFKKIADR